MKAYERLLKYVKFDTRSSDDVEILLYGVVWGEEPHKQHGHKSDIEQGLYSV